MRYRPPKSPTLVAVLAVAVLGACGEVPTVPVDVDVQLARGGAGPKVKEADPNIAPQDTTLDVRVIGTGFDQGSVAEFLLSGQSEPKIVTNATTFVDKNNLIANITIPLDADVALYDIEVTSSRGKKGIGSELFSVVEKGSNGNPSLTPLTVVIEAGTISSDGGGSYSDGDAGVEAFIGTAGTFRFLVGDPRNVDIGEIRDGGDNVLVLATGLHGALIQTVGCCDLNAMTADSAGVPLSGSTIPIKLKIQWNVSNGFYLITMGANNGCIDPGSGSDPPDDDPGRGTWARATRTSATTWTIESVGPAALCRYIDEKGKKNDRYEPIVTDVIVDLRVLLSGLQ